MLIALIIKELRTTSSKHERFYFFAPIYNQLFFIFRLKIYQKTKYIINQIETHTK